MKAIDLRQVSFSYDGKTKILENADFTAEYGEVTLLSGHSGEGKSTLMYIVSGIIPNVNYGELTGEVKIAGEDIKGKTIACAGFGNVTWGICKKALHLGAKVVTLSGPDGYIYDEEGVSSSQEKVDYLLEMRNSGRNRVQDYADKFGVPFYPGEKPWGVKVDVVMPSAMQNDVHMEHAKQIVANGVKYYIEVANMPTTNDALEFLKEQKHMVVAPSKAVNAGGVSVSELEMAQNAERLYWTAEEVDAKLQGIMKNIYHSSVEVAERYGLGYDLVAGANIVGFQKVADAMMAQGIV